MFDRSTLDQNPYIIAEIGQNHQGDPEIAINYIREFAARGASAVKFQTRNNKFLFSKDAYNAPYESENSFADIYGQHREKLELDLGTVREIKEECQTVGTDFISTPFDEISLDALMNIGVDALKLASFDIGNLPLINLMAQTGVPIIMSIGGGNAKQIHSSVEQILTHHDKISILHCVSEYPCPAERMGLDNIKVLIKEYPNLIIGLSDHFNGTLSGPLAYLAGARVFEKHVTLNRSWRGTDHSFALEPEGFRKFVRDIRRTPKMMQPKPKAELGSEPVFKKLGKSLTAKENLKKGTVLKLESLSGKIFRTQHIAVRECNSVLGRSLNKNLKIGAPIKLEDLE